MRDGRGTPLRSGSWEEALDRVTAAIRRAQRAHGPAAVGCFGGGGLTNEKAHQLGKFARVALRTSAIDYNGRFCMSSAATACQRAFGIDRGLRADRASAPAGRPGHRPHPGQRSGQGNGQGGREHGQKADQLPGYRKLTDPAARAHVATVWRVDPDELPEPGPSPAPRGCSPSLSRPRMVAPGSTWCAPVALRS